MNSYTNENSYDVEDLKVFNIDVELMLDKFAKHWISFEKALEIMEAPKEIYYNTLCSEVVSLGEYIYYYLCDAGQIDLSDCLVHNYVPFDYYGEAVELSI